MKALKICKLEYLKKTPEDLINSYIWDDHAFIQNNAPCKKNHYRTLSHKVNFPADIMRENNGLNSFLTYDEVNLKFEDINRDEYLSLKVVITQSAQRLGKNINMISSIKPFRPSNLNLIFLCQKGCSQWAKLFKRKLLSNKVLVKRERAWENSLGNIQGNYFWDNCYNNVNSFFYDNKLKIFYYNIIRGTLKTNRIVHHFVPGLTEMCTFCNTHSETILHLFYDCEITKIFIDIACDYIGQTLPIFSITPGRKEFIFGVRNEKIYSPTNLFVIMLKYYIWTSRCAKNMPVLINFINWFKKELRFKKACYGHMEQMQYLNLLHDI